MTEGGSQHPGEQDREDAIIVKERPKPLMSDSRSYQLGSLPTYSAASGQGLPDSSHTLTWSVTIPDNTFAVQEPMPGCPHLAVKLP